MRSYDLRTYYVAEGAIATLERVLREVALPIMPEHGLRPVGFWASPDGGTLYQITEHESAEAITGDWDRLHADPRWKAGLAAIRQDRSAVRAVVTTILSDIAGLSPGAASAGEA